MAFKEFGLAFTSTNRVIRMPVCPTTFTEVCLSNSREERGAGFTLVPRSLPAPVIPHIVLLPEKFCPLDAQPGDQSLNQNERQHWCAELFPGWLKRARLYISSQACVQWHHVAGLKLFMVEVLIPQRQANASQGFFLPQRPLSNISHWCILQWKLRLCCLFYNVCSRQDHKFLEPQNWRRSKGTADHSVFSCCLSPGPCAET